MKPTDKFLFDVMDQIDGTVKQVKSLAKEVSDTLTPVAEEAASYLEKASTTVSDEIKKVSDASGAAADKEHCKEVLLALSQYANNTSLNSEVINAMHQVSAYYQDETPIFSHTEEDADLFVLIMTAMHSSMQKASLSTYRKTVEWVVLQYQKADNQEEHA